MNFCISTINYLDSTDLVVRFNSATPNRRKDAIRYKYCPSIAELSVSSITITNQSEVSYPIGSIVFGNVRVEGNNVIGLVTLHIDSTSLISAGSANFYAGNHTFSTIYDRYIPSGYAKSVPIILDPLNELVLPPGASLRIGMAGATTFGWLWLGPCYQFKRGISKPTKSNINIARKSVEMENGDKVRFRGMARKSITCNFQALGDEDRSFMLSNMSNGELYYVSGFAPTRSTALQEASGYSPKLLNIIDWGGGLGESVDTIGDDVLRWREHTGLVRYSSPAALSSLTHLYSSASLQFMEVM